MDSSSTILQYPGIISNCKLLAPAVNDFATALIPEERIPWH
jgi:hypothetical protein